MILIYRVNPVMGESTLIATADDSLREQVREWCKLKTATATATADKAGLSPHYVFAADTDVQPFTASQLEAEVHHLEGGGGANQKS